MRDTIERTIQTKADLSRTWAAFGTPEGLCAWFAGTVEGEWVEGGRAVLCWGEHRSAIRILHLEQERRFAYEWIPGINSDDLTPGRTTRVEFTFKANAEGGTTIQMIESGFAALPKEFYSEAFGNNDEGWTEELAKLQAMLSQ